MAREVMAREDHASGSSPTLAYPAPTLVIGVGRFGLAVLEHLGEDWMWLSTAAGSDASLKNLRLLHVGPAGARGQELASEVDATWRAGERQISSIARYIGDDERPSLALNFAILRSLGLIRYHDGVYQIAIPRDEGVTEKGKGRHQARRLRYFHWTHLSADPISAAERLRLESQRSSELDSFLTPILERVRHGDSPRLLLHCISHCRALCEGRDPSPWPWFIEEASALDDEGASRLRIAFREEWLTDDDRAGLLESALGEAVSGWRRVTEGARAELVLPRLFLPRSHDLPSPLDPLNLLRMDWEATGWAAGEIQSDNVVEFHPVESSLFRLGFFDHDGSSRVHEAASQERSGVRMEERLTELGRDVHRGLVRLWVDLQRSRVKDVELTMDERHRQNAERSLEQSLTVLGELIVSPIIEGDEGQEPAPAFPEERVDAWVDGAPLLERASSFLRNLALDEEAQGATTQHAVAARLAALGLPFEERAVASRKIFRELTLEPADVEASRLESGDGGLSEFRTAVNEEVRHLYNFSHLTQYRTRPSRSSARLTIYVVADMSDPFTRRTVRPLLRDLHAELLRAYAPLFHNSRSGFDRSLCITPMVWMPHPADAFGGQHLEANRLEEAAIIESVQGIRRWVESVPREVRCLNQVYINSRITDNAVLSIRDAVRQTRDFVSFQVRNDTARDPWLRKAVVGPSGDDVYATFTCHEIDFPAERAREYLASRFARECLARLREGERSLQADVDAEPFAPPAVNDLLQGPDRSLGKHTSGVADRLAGRIEDRTTIAKERTSRELLNLFDDAFEEDLYRQVTESWVALTRDRGNMDDMIDDLRRGTSRHLGETLRNVRRYGDGLIEEQASQGGLKSTLRAFNTLAGMTREKLESTEGEKRRSEALCVAHRIPDPRPIAQTRADVVQAAQDKPDYKPMVVGLVLWLLMAPALGGPIAHAISQGFDLHLRPGVAEFLLGPLGLITGGALVFLPVFFLLRRHMRLAVERLQDAVRAMADGARRVVEGGDAGLFNSNASIRSFFAARLRLTVGLAVRNYATRVHQQVTRDRQLAHRLIRGVEVQQAQLQRRAEHLGVRPVAIDSEGARIDDDLRHLFATRQGEATERLANPTALTQYYKRHISNDRDIDAVMPRFIASAGGFARWRTEACMADTDRVLAMGRKKFEEVVTTPICDQLMFDEEIGARLTEFVSRHYANIGFGARFAGLEGFDANGLEVLADASLVVHPALQQVFERARRRPGAPATTETLDIIESKVLPNSAFMLSLVQGIRSDSIRNLRRFELYPDHAWLEDDEATHRYHAKKRSHRPVTVLTGHEGLRDDIHQRFVGGAPSIRLSGTRITPEISGQNDDTGGADE